MLTEIDHRELANFMDTEGFIGMIYSKPEDRVIPLVVLSNTNKPWLEAIEDKWGGKVGIQRKPKPNYKTLWGWQVHGTYLSTVLKAIRPYLQLKGENADLCIELQTRITQKMGRYSNGRLTVEEKRLRFELYQRCKILTSRGDRLTTLTF